MFFMSGEKATTTNTPSIIIASKKFVGRFKQLHLEGFG
jgi:hypothetical protein